MEGIAALPELLQSIAEQDTDALCDLLRQKGWPQEIPLWLVYLWDRERRTLQLIYPKPVFLEGERIPAALFGVLETRQATVDNNDPDLWGRWAASRDYATTLAIPLFADSEPVAMVQGYTDLNLESAARALYDFQRQADVTRQSFHLLNLLKEKERQAFTDGLTGLFNSQFLRSFLENALKRCQRYDRPVAVVFVDIDSFKYINDRYGHPIGSHVLREVAEFLREQVRESDLVTRYGGDEFVVVVADHDLEATRILAERVREGVERHAFGSEMGKSLQLTISAGIAVFPEHARTVDGLIESADRAMYKAKQESKNRVCCAV